MSPSNSHSPSGNGRQTKGANDLADFNLSDIHLTTRQGFPTPPDVTDAEKRAKEPSEQARSPSFFGQMYNTLRFPLWTAGALFGASLLEESNKAPWAPEGEKPVTSWVVKPTVTILRQAATSAWSGTRSLVSDEPNGIPQSADPAAPIAAASAIVPAAAATATPGASSTPASSAIPSTAPKTQEAAKEEPLKMVARNFEYITTYMREVEPNKKKPEIDLSSDVALLESVHQCLERLAIMSPRFAGKTQLVRPLELLQEHWGRDREYAAESFNSLLRALSYDLGLNAIGEERPGHDSTAAPSATGSGDADLVSKPPKVVGTVSTEITEAGARMKYFLYQINRSIAQAGLPPPKLKLDSAESISKTLAEIDSCLAQMQVSDIERVAIDGHNFRKIIQEVRTAWSKGTKEGLAAVHEHFLEIED